MTDNDAKINQEYTEADNSLKKEKGKSQRAPLLNQVENQAPPDMNATLKAAREAAKFEQLYAEEQQAQQAQRAIAELSDAEAEAQFQKYLDSQVNTILPHVPDDGAWRYCWVPTDSVVSSDNVHVRLRGGWQLVKWGEVPGFTPEVMNNRSATIGDVISFNEMVLMRIPKQVWEKIMTYHHHTATLEQEASIRERAMSLIGDTTKLSNPEYVSEDLQNYGRSRKKPSFKGV
jgi:hypothetical protein